MSTLSIDSIRARLSDPNLERRLVVSPILSEKEQLKEGQASIDVRLGFEFALIYPSSFGSVDEFDSKRALDLSELYKKIYVPFGKSITIHPHQLILATTLEYIRLPFDLMAYVVGRSTWGRLGLINATAVGIHPFYAGSLTLELRNLGETPLALYPGQAIGQLIFHEMDGCAKARTMPHPGQYSGSVDMIPRVISGPHTRDRIKALCAKFNTNK